MDDLFKVHVLNDEGMKKAQKLQILFNRFLEDVQEVVPESRELSVVKTKLQEASFFAKRGMAMQKENQR